MVPPTNRDVSPGELEAAERYRVLLERLVSTSPELATAFMEAAPSVAYRVGYENIPRWARTGEQLASGGWANLGLAIQFFETTPELLDLIDFDGFSVLVDTTALLASSTADLASHCLGQVGHAIGALPNSTRRPFLEVLRIVAARCRADLDRCLERTPVLLAPLSEEIHGPLLELARHGVQLEGGAAFALFCAAAEALPAMPPGVQESLLEEAAALGITNPVVALEMIKGAPEVFDRLQDPAALRWRRAGRELLDDPGGQDRARSWFRVESAQAREYLSELAGRVDMADVAGLLRLYAQALAGQELVVQPVGVLTGRGIGWSATGRASTDGTSVYLPNSIDTFEDHEANFAAFKVHTTLQATRLTHGSFAYVDGGAGTYLGATVHTRDGSRSTEDPIGRRPAMRVYYDRFEDRRLITWLFALVEGTRIDAVVTREYPGIAPWLARLREHAAETRARHHRPTQRQLFAESLVIASLGFPERCPTQLSSAALDLFDVVRRRDATVQDSAQAASMLYDLTVAVPNVLPDSESRPRGTAAQGEGSEIPFDAPEQPELHGDYKPETVQTMDLLDAAEDDDRPALTREDLEDLLRDNVELEVGGQPIGRDELTSTLDNMEREATERALGDAPDIDDSGADDSGADDSEGGSDPDPVDPDPESNISWFRYDEWDFRAHDYLNAHCRVGQRPATQGDLGLYQESLREHHRLVVQTRRRFEQLRPEAFRRINRLEDGSDIDLDEVIAFHADKLAGSGPLARFYTRRNKIVRDVAVALLIDQSASTREPAAQESKRVIDVMKDATVLMVEALEATGDAYGIYGFSGQGHDNVEIHVVKELDGTLDDEVRQRVAGIEPIGATRMGPAIRHVVAQLHAYPAKVKLLILVSDGRPEDEDYGPDRGGIDYPLHDTKRALVEAKRNRIEPFLITVDSAGNDYLAQMCGDLGYEVVSEVESLPRRLPRLYRYLTAE
jgi:nitric oxide reductase activation protein